jgi:hypothetical protein
MSCQQCFEIVELDTEEAYAMSVILDEQTIMIYRAFDKNYKLTKDN